MQSLLDTVAREIRVVCWPNPNSSSPTDSTLSSSAPGSGTASVPTQDAVCATSTALSNREPRVPYGVADKKRGSRGSPKSLLPREDTQAEINPLANKDSRQQQSIIARPEIDKGNLISLSRNYRDHFFSRGEDSTPRVSASRLTPSRKRPRAADEYRKEGAKLGQSGREGLRGNQSGASSTSDSDTRPATSSAVLAIDVGRSQGGRNRNASLSFTTCQYEGCPKAPVNAARRFCRTHGEGRRCKTSGCHKVDVGGGSCRKHGGGRRCGADGCRKTDVGGGFCVSHGGGKRCQAQDCAKGAQAGGVFCKSHGGGRRCRIEGCMTSAQSGADILCIKHGGGKRCVIPGCRKLVRKNKRCTKHAFEKTSVSAEGPSDVRTHSPTRPLQQSSWAEPRASQAPSHRRLSELGESPCSERLSPAGPSPSPSPAPGDDRRGGRHEARHNADSSRDPFTWPWTSLMQLPVLAILGEASAGGSSSGGGRNFRPNSPALSTKSIRSFCSQHSVEPPHSGHLEIGAQSLPLPPPPPPESASYSTSRGPISTTFEYHDGRGFPAMASAKAQRGPSLAAVSNHGAVGVMNCVAAHDDRTSLHPELWRALPSPRVSAFDGLVGSGATGAPLNRHRESLCAVESECSGRGGATAVPTSLEPLPTAAAGGNGGVAVGVAASKSRNFSRSFVPDASSRRFEEGAHDGESLRPQRQEDTVALSAMALGVAPHPGPPHRVRHRSQFRDGAAESSLSPSPRTRSLSPSPLPPSLKHDINSSYGVRTTPQDTDEVSDSTEWRMSREQRGGRVGGSYDKNVGSSNGNAVVSSYMRDWETSSTALNWSSTRTGVIGYGNGPAPSFASMPLSYSSPNDSDPVPYSSDPTTDSTAVEDSVDSRPQQPGRGVGYSSGSGVVSALESGSGLDSRRPDIDRSRSGGGCCRGGGRGGGGKASPSLDAGSTRGSSSPVSRVSTERLRRSGSPLPNYISLSVDGMMCMENCGQIVQRVLSDVEGVKSVTVHFPTRTVSVQIQSGWLIPVKVLTSALDSVGFSSTCIAISNTEDDIDDSGVNAVWAIASALGLVDPGCAMAWGDSCTCGDDCKCVNCPQHMKKVSQAVDLVVKAMDLSTADAPAPPPGETPPSTPVEAGRN